MASPATRNSINWSPPISGHLKCNLDAGFAHGTNITEMGCCVRNHVVALVASYMNSRSPCMDVKEGETQALLTAMKFVISLGLQHVTFEMDCKSIVDKIIKPFMDDFEFANIIQDIEVFLAVIQPFSQVLLRDKPMKLSMSLLG